MQALRSATHAVSHASREVAPSYLLPADKSFGTICVQDDQCAVARTLAHKLALASPQAKAKKDFSPLWEAVVNLRRPEAGEEATAYRQECAERIKAWSAEYAKLTGHNVLRIDVHLDEGHMVDGKAVLNAHAHVMIDRTDPQGRVKRLDKKAMRKVQDMTAQVTGLSRGTPSPRKHLAHQAYKYLAEQGRLDKQQAVEPLREEIQQVKGSSDMYGRLLDTANNTNKRLKKEMDELKAAYAAERAALKASGEAKQADYQRLKAQHDADLNVLKVALADLSKAGQELDQVKKELHQVKGELAKQKASQEAVKPPPEAPARKLVYIRCDAGDVAFLRSVEGVRVQSDYSHQHNRVAAEITKPAIVELLKHNFTVVDRQDQTKVARLNPRTPTPSKTPKPSRGDFEP